jgi:UPF0755 protein
VPTQPRTRVRAHWPRRLFFLILWAGLLVGVAYGSASIFLPASATRKQVFVTVSRGATVNQVAEQLEKQGLIRTRYAFIIMARLLGEASNLKSGQYRLSPTLRPSEIVDRMARGEVIALTVTIPEGYTMEQIADLLKQRKIIDDAREFKRLARTRGRFFDAGFPIESESLEGYLFPDTYAFPRGVVERAAIQMMLENFARRAYRPLRDEIKARGISLRQAVVIASMVEREAQVAEDRPRVASVIYNRLKIRMPLQVDATVLYALKKHKPIVTFEDLKVRSPYNTYRRRGLPPGPICSPGFKALEATVKPAKADYLYYVAMPDGSHVFTRTLDEHNRAVAEARRARAGT